MGVHCYQRFIIIANYDESGSLSAMLSTFNSFIHEAPRTVIHISVFYTRATTRSPSMYQNLHPNIVIKASRPKIARILESVIEKTCASSQDRPHGVFIGACGPVGLAEQARSAVGSIDIGRAEAVGGLELCEE